MQLLVIGTNRPLARRDGYTLIEIVVIFVLLLVITLIAVPRLYNARAQARRNYCINNLRQILGAKISWSLEKKKSPGQLVSETEINLYIKNGAPICPSSGRYSYGVVGTNPACTIPGHTV